jgi:sigma-B regulation protein RsbQ
MIGATKPNGDPMPADVLKRNNVNVLGKGEQVMLFAHGFGCDQNMWRFIVPAFENDHRIVLFDYVGSGKSDSSAFDAERYSTLDGYASDVVEIMRALDLRDVIFVGHSVSSMIGVLAAKREPSRFSKLVMVGPSPCYINEGDYIGGFSRADIAGLLDLMDKNYIGWANFLAPIVMKNDANPQLTGELRESFCSTDPVIARRFAETTFYSDNRKDVEGVVHPSLILQCADDSIAPLEVGDFLHSKIRQSTLVRMKATGHCPHMSHPEETIAAMREFVGSR